MKFKSQVQDFIERIDQINNTLIKSIEHSSITPIDAIKLLRQSSKIIEQCNEYLNQENEKS